jgi:hypothetical protein
MLNAWIGTSHCRRASIASLPRLFRLIAQDGNGGYRQATQGYFTPIDEPRAMRFAEYLPLEAALHQTVMDLRPLALASSGTVNESLRMRVRNRLHRSRAAGERWSLSCTSTPIRSCSVS